MERLLSLAVTLAVTLTVAVFALDAIKRPAASPVSVKWVGK